MTTIAYDGKHLAVDSRVTNTAGKQRKHTCTSCGEHTEVVADDTEKLHINVDGKWKLRGEKIIAVGGAGMSTFIGRVIDAMKTGDDIEALYKDFKKLDGPHGPSASFLVVTEKKVYTLTSNDKAFDVKEYGRGEFVAVGSGNHAARMANSLSGAPAYDAINMAMLLDDSTGGTVHYVDCTDPKLEKKSMKPLKAQAAVDKYKTTPAKQTPAAKKTIPVKKTQPEKKDVKAQPVKKPAPKLTPQIPYPKFPR